LQAERIDYRLEIPLKCLKGTSKNRAGPAAANLTR
jgi:hypothetical protein